jgi:hypothetical protein
MRAEFEVMQYEFKAGVNYLATANAKENKKRSY